MNTQHYRIIFNKARGMLMAVAETVCSAGKGAGTTRRSGVVTPLYLAALGPLNWSLLVAFGLAVLSTPVVQAQIVADPNVSKTLQATVLQAVSYTHLDVYKRQCTTFAASENPRARAIKPARHLNGYFIIKLLLIKRSKIKTQVYDANSSHTFKQRIDETPQRPDLPRRRETSGREWCRTCLLYTSRCV